MQRGDVYFIKSGVINNTGFTIYGSRPAVVLSCHDINRSEHLVEVVFLTSSPKKDLDYHVSFMCRDRVATALCEQVTTVETSMLTEYVMTVPTNVLYDIEDAVCKSLGIATESTEGTVSAENSSPVYGWNGHVKDWKAEAEHWKQLYLQQLKITAEVLK